MEDKIAHACLLGNGIVPRGFGVSAAAIGYVSPTTDVRVTTPLVSGFEMSSRRRRWRMLPLWW